MRRAALMLACAMALLGLAVGIGMAQTQATTPPPQEPALDEGDITSEVALTRAAIQVRRQALVTAVMDLDGKESDAFWPLYREYRQEMAKVGDRFVKLLNGYLASYENLTDDQAKKLMDEYLSIERAKNSVKSKYVGKFSKAIPPRKVARFFQIDNKMDAVINGELAQTIPLAR
jgi:hypothetical protein